ncbi:MAG TPA: chemotaxis protein CheX [Synergistaceae bacterium]|nr:chemotaxis protein CheX [Synergistaceae bacterium]HPQ36450.1 chemotaxis protein CheX [Synergistaceae bacterium]
MAPHHADLEKITLLVNSFGKSMIEVSDKMGVSISFIKRKACLGINAPGSKVATLISVHGEGCHGTISLFMDMASFSEYVNKLTHGIIAPSTTDDTALSVAGEISNMISGQAVIALSQKGFEGLDITPPQIFTGENIKTLRLPEEQGYTFTLPFNITDKPQSLVYQALLFRK